MWRLRRAGFANLTVDLIYGVPGFGGESLRRSLGMALSLEAEHLSAYHLTIEPGTVLGRRMAEGRFAPVAEETSEREFACVHDTLTAAGYEHYEVSNFARPGRRARHNASYWTGEPYLGIGPGAHSFDGAERRWCEPGVAEYIAGPRYGSERLTERDRANETVMTALRTADGLDTEAFGARYGAARLARTMAAAQPFLKSGALCSEGGRLRIPAERFLLSDAVIAALFDA